MEFPLKHSQKANGLSIGTQSKSHWTVHCFTMDRITHTLSQHTRLPIEQSLFGRAYNTHTLSTYRPWPASLSIDIHLSTLSLESASKCSFPWNMAFIDSTASSLWIALLRICAMIPSTKIIIIAFPMAGDLPFKMLVSEPIRKRCGIEIECGINRCWDDGTVWTRLGRWKRECIDNGREYDEISRVTGTEWHWALWFKKDSEIVFWLELACSQIMFMLKGRRPLQFNIVELDYLIYSGSYRPIIFQLYMIV